MLYTLRGQGVAAVKERMTPDQEAAAFRELIRVAHEAMKDLRHVLNEVKVERRAIEELLGRVPSEAAINQQILNNVNTGLTAMNVGLTEFVHNAQLNIFDVFNSIVPDELIEAKLNNIAARTLGIPYRAEGDGK